MRFLNVTAQIQLNLIVAYAVYRFFLLFQMAKSKNKCAYLAYFLNLF